MADWLKNPIGAAAEAAKDAAQKAAKDATKPAGGASAPGSETLSYSKFQTSVSTLTNIINGSAGPGIGTDKLSLKDGGEKVLKDFVVKSLGSLTPDAGAKADPLKALNEYAKSKDLPEITDLKDMTGKHLALLINGLRENGKIDFEQTKPGGDPSFIFAFADVAAVVKPTFVTKLPYGQALEGINNNAGPRPATKAGIDGGIVVAAALTDEGGVIDADAEKYVSFADELDSAEQPVAAAEIDSPEVTTVASAPVVARGMKV